MSREAINFATQVMEDNNTLIGENLHLLKIYADVKGDLKMNLIAKNF